MTGGRFAVAVLCALMSLGSGQPATGQPATGQPATGQPATGQPATGQPATGQPATGQPATGQAGRAMQAASRLLIKHLAMKTVRYRGYAFLVPRSWPVIDDRGRSPGCVRFDQHAIYLGAVRGDEFCPSW